MRRLLVSALCLLAFRGAANAATFDRDDRIAITRPDAQFRAIGVVTGGRRIAYATGFLVDDCLVLTVKHAAGAVPVVTGLRLRFVLPFGGRAGASDGTVIAAGTLDLVGDARRLDRSGDWLLLRLDRCLGARFGHVDLSAAVSDPFRTSLEAGLVSAGFPIDRSWRRQLTVDPACRVRGRIGAALIHDCSALPGNSGSPLFATGWRDGEAVLALVGMQSTAKPARGVLPYRGEDASVATRISDVLPAIRPFLRPDALP